LITCLLFLGATVHAQLYDPYDFRSDMDRWVDQHMDQVQRLDTEMRLENLERQQRELQDMQRELQRQREAAQRGEGVGSCLSDACRRLETQRFLNGGR
jgi:hypothetical protein